MKRRNPNVPNCVDHNCVGLISSFFCPPTNVTTAPQSGVAFIQSEFEKFSAPEQERIYRDLYGLDVTAAHMEEEDPDLIGRKLNEMELEIDAIKSKNAYEEAVRRCPRYLEKLKLMFLRAALFDARKAAGRFVKHLEAKVELFGCDRAFSGSVKQAALDKADMECLAGGGMQIVPEKDRGGRTVFWARRELIRFQATENFLRTLWYLIMSQLEADEDSQRNGWVALTYNVGPFPLEYFNKELYSKIWKVVKVLPIRIVGYHSCFNDLKLCTINPFLLLFMGKETRARFRSHVGAHAECLFEIMTYGIPLHVLPVTMDGQFDSHTHLSWMEQIREIQSNSLNE